MISFKILYLKKKILLFVDVSMIDQNTLKCTFILIILSLCFRINILCIKVSVSTTKLYYKSDENLLSFKYLCNLTKYTY